MTLGEKIKECRKRANISQEKVAELVGVSRQAVTKWESNLSAPSTENLFKLADIFETTVDFLLTSPKVAEPSNQSIAEQIYALYKNDEAKKLALKKAARKRNFSGAIGMCLAYLAVYMIGRFIWCADANSVMGFLVFAKPIGAGSYLYGWLLHQHLFWWPMLISVVSILFGKYKFSIVNFTYFLFGILIGFLLGPTKYGTGEYGWAFWGGIYAVSFPIGILLERRWKPEMTLKSKEGKLWVGVVLLGIVVMSLLVWLFIPKWKMPY